VASIAWKTPLVKSDAMGSFGNKKATRRWLELVRGVR
jgi:hypothetical protein